MKRFLCIIFAALMAVSTMCLASCDGKAADTTPKTSAETDTYENVPDGLPELNYGKTDFTVIIPAGECETDVFIRGSASDDALKSAVNTRNMNVEDRFGVKLVIECEGDYNEVNTKIRNSVKSGSDDYQLAFVQMVFGSQALALDNSLLPFEELEYVDLSKPWWDSTVKNAFSIKNHLLMANGDISPSSFNLTSCMYFNKTLFDNNDLEYPYEDVKNGTWTLDKLYELTKDFTTDKDGDGAVTRDGKDQFGLASWCLDVPYSLYYGGGGMIISKDDADVPYYNLQQEHDTLLYQKIFNIIIKNGAYFESIMDETRFPNVAKTFHEGRALFLDGKLSTVESIRDMNNAFGILPIPKLNEEQKDYQSFVNGASMMVCVPASVKDPQKSSVILEAMASESYRVVTPVLKENYLKRKTAQDYQSAEMIDYIIRNRVFDMAYIYMFDGIGSFVRNCLISETEDISSTIASYKKSTQRKIANMVNRFDNAYNK